jgi:hypothetical protein
MSNGKTPTWLGTQRCAWTHEEFPPGVLNEKQLRLLLSLERGGRKIIGLDLDPAILKLTDTITEIHFRFGFPRDRYAASLLYVWISTDGEYLAAVEGIDRDPSGVQPPDDTVPATVKGYYRHPSMGGFARAFERLYPHGTWSLGHDGAVEQTRLYIRKVWVEQQPDGSRSAEDYFAALEATG